jgi:hypothetical protein
MRARSWIAAVSGTALVVAAGLVGAGSLTSANADPVPVPTPGSGQIILATSYDTSGAGFVFWVPTGKSIGDTGTLTQNLTTTTNNGCIMANPTSASPAILNFTANGTAQVGYQPGSNGGSVGVSSKGGNATACTQVNQKEKESLTIDLNSPATSLPSSTPVQAVKATIDVEAKGNVIITATLYSKGSATGEKFTLYSGKSQLASLGAYQANCNVTSVADSGPDAGSGDNCPWTILPTKSFDKIVLTTSSPSGAAFSVEGGGDWTDPANHRTVFDVVTNAMGILDCGATTDPYSTTVNGNVTSAQVTRAANGPDAAGVVPDCQLIPYAIGTSDGTATFHKPLTDQATAQFSVDFSRTVDPNTLAISTDSTSPFVVGTVAPLQVDWENGVDVSTLTYCPAGLYTGLDSLGVPTFDYTKVPGDLSSLTGTQYACKYAETQTFDPATGQLTVQNLVYLTGDVKFYGG